MGVPRTVHDQRKECKDTRRLTDKSGEHERGPEADFVLELRRGEGRERADVDAPVKEVVDPRDGDVRIDDDALAGRQRLDEHARLAILVSDERADVALDPAGAERDDDRAHDPAGQAAAVRQARGDAGEEEDEEADEVDGAEEADGLVAPPLCVGDDGAEDGREVGEELEHVLQARCGGLALVECTRGAQVAVGGCAGGGARGQRVLEVVLERAGEPWGA